MANIPPNTQDELDGQALMEQLIRAFMAVASPEDMLEFWRGVPSELEAAFVQIIEAFITRTQQDGHSQLADDLAARLRDFKQIQAQAAQAQNLPPVIKALRAFIAADDETAARAVFAAQNALLQPYEAQHWLDNQQADDPALQQRLQARSALLRELRGATPPPTPIRTPVTVQDRPPTLVAEEQSLTFHNQGLKLGGNLYQAETITIHTVRQMARLWRKPAAPDPGAMVPRSTDMQRVLDKLRHTGNVALTGKAQRVGVYGMPGVGKTTLAKLLAHTAQADYSDGVLWLEVGPHLRKREDGQALLNQAMCDHFVADGEHKNFTPEAARALWAEHPNMLVVFDNVWSLEGIKLLREALPAQTHQLLTTRRRDLLHNSGMSAETLDVLSEADALALVALRLDSAPAKQRARVDWLTELIQPLGYHPLALDIALRLMQPDDTLSQWRNIIQDLVKAVREGNAFNQLQLDEDIDSQANVAAALQVSYDYLPNDNIRQRFCQLGVFALESAFGATQAAAVWQCEQAEAENTLRLFNLQGLLQYSDIQLQIFAANPTDAPTPPERVWQQHSLVRGYALALLRQSLGFEASAYRHANAYNEAMQHADDAQAYHTLWYAYGQLVQAFEWSIVNNLTLAQRLIGNCANLQGQSNRLGHNLDWSQRALQAAGQRATSSEIAAAQLSLGNALQRSAAVVGDKRATYLMAALAAYDEALRFRRADSAPLAYAQTQNNRATLLSEIATLPGEDRRARLLAALAAYDEALRFRRADSAPLDYATTQNNRANLLSEIATLPGEDRRARLLAALAAYDEALRFRRADSAPLDYATTQNNRANLLSEIATLSGEDRRARLLAALAAYDEALRFLRADSAPLAYATTQNNRANRLSEIATLPGEDRRARLLAALAAYDEALRFLRADSAPLDYAQTQNNRATLLSEIATLPGEDRRARLLAALAAYDEALRFRRADSAPLAYAQTQNNRANLLSEIATLPGEDRRARLLAALAAYDEALRFFRADSAPFDYATTQNNRANRLSEIATLPGEDRRARLLAALAAYDEALRFLRADSAPLDYAQTQNNRATLLSEIATLPGEDRRARLLAALAAYDEALRFLRADSAPLAYATTQNNRANRLSEIATLPGEDRRARLLAALAAYDEALRFLRADSAPLDYAQTQNNRANRLSEIATLPGEDRRARLLAALAAYDEALRFRRADSAPLAYATTQNNRANLLSEIATLPGEDRRARLLAALAAYDEALRFLRADSAPLAYATTQNNRANRLSEIATLPGEDRRARLLAALSCARQAVGLFEQLEHTQYLQTAQNTLRRVWQACGDDAESLWQAAGLGALPDLTPSPPNLAEADWQALLQRFAAIQDRQALIEFWRAVPSKLEAPLIQIVEGLIKQAQSAGDDDTASALQARLEGFKAISAQAAAASSSDP